MFAIGAHQGYVYIRAEYPLAVERLEKAIVEAILFHGRMQLFNIKEGVDDEEMDKTVKHIVSNPGEFRRYLKNKIIFA